jgi:hypothetical protein
MRAGGGRGQYRQRLRRRRHGSGHKQEQVIRIIPLIINLMSTLKNSSSGSTKIIITMGFTHPWVICRAGFFNAKNKMHSFFLLSFACLPWSLDRAGQGPKESNKEKSSVSDGLIALLYHL